MLAAFAASHSHHHHRCLPCDRGWGRAHHWHPPAPAFRWTAFELCVANHEAGEPGSESISTVNWSIVDPPYEGGFQWLPSTWAWQKARGMPELARDASPQQQARVFAAHWNASEWPRSVPACGG